VGEEWVDGWVRRRVEGMGARGEHRFMKLMKLKKTVKKSDVFYFAGIFIYIFMKSLHGKNKKRSITHYLPTHVHTRIHTCTHVHTRSQTYINVRTRTYTYKVHIRTHTYTLLHTQLYPHTYTHVHTDTYIHVHTRTYTSIPTSTHVHTRTHTYIHVQRT
jgi:hypothetical protein